MLAKQPLLTVESSSSRDARSTTLNSRVWSHQSKYTIFMNHGFLPLTRLTRYVNHPAQSAAPPPKLILGAVREILHRSKAIPSTNSRGYHN